MWKSVIYKEWLKIRWFLLGFILLGVAGIGYLFLMVQHGFTFSGGKNYWYGVLFMGFKYYAYFKYIPLIGGLAIGIAQYFPETIDKRIKLAFHLPLKENKLLIMMHSFGGGCLLVVFLLFYTIFCGLSFLFFPKGIVWDAMISMFPWFLAGLTAYFWVALVVLEPVWKFRVLYSVVAAFFIPMYLYPADAAAYAPVNLYLLLFTFILSIGLLFPAYRFRKGEM